MSSGVVFGLYRLTTLPWASTRNFVKFQGRAVDPSGSGAASRRKQYSGAAPSPLTSIFANIGKFTSYFERANSRISASVPGSCLPNWLQAKARTFRSSRFSCSVRRPAYWGVSPHWLATLTTSAALPANWSNFTESPVIDFISNSWNFDMPPA